MFSIIPAGTKFDFVGKRYVWLGISSLIVISTIALLVTGKGLNYGIDFTGGAEVHVKVPTEWNQATLRSQLIDGGLKGLKLVSVGDPANNEFMVRAQGGNEKELAGVADAVTAVLAKAFPSEGAEKRYAILRSDIVGPAAGNLLKRNGLLAAFYAFLVIFIYVAVRFDSRYAPGALMALFHDSIVVLGVFVLTGRQFDLSILAAILALIGYSNNDTIIVYDRVRETQQLHPDWTIERTVNTAINETIARTIVTSVTTFIVVASIFWLGGPVIENFAFTLMCGVVVGTYSSMFIASSLIITITKMRQSKEERMKLERKEKRQKRRTYEVRPEPKAQL